MPAVADETAATGASGVTTATSGAGSTPPVGRTRVCGTWTDVIPRRLDKRGAPPWPGYGRGDSVDGCLVSDPVCDFADQGGAHREGAVQPDRAVGRRAQARRTNFLSLTT
ncbi:hypothetical protein GCM10009802_12860 [Streptomyces synnematoformans]|uniref:Uncharacterized protein n=1 Tax=Streptomyces synnematoformans TaxID=415721 RepID=A0ABN2XLZ6_9ACTN